MKNQTIEVFTNYDHSKNHEIMLKGDYENTFFYITDFTPFNRDLHKKGLGSLNLFTLDHIKNWENLSREKYKKKKNEVIEIFIKRIEKLMPDIRKHIELTELATPRTMKRYTSNPEGAIYGFSNINSQSGINRFTNITPVKGLYLAGAYTYPGPGFFSCILSGTNAAKLVLKES
jgi:all-trans-retinol 13,14-reductase